MGSKESAYRFRHVPKADKKPEDLIADAEKEMGGRITENTLSDEQRSVFRTICDWYEKERSDLLTLGGYAGTGKSTLISVLASKYADKRIGFCAFTGKATSVLRKKFYEANIPRNAHVVSTLHSLIYQPIPDKDRGGIRAWKKKDTLEVDLVVVDEASMLNKDLFDDLRGYGKPILAVGDHGQLPPVFGSLNLMENPHLRLETIHRQAQGSPILALSAFVRQTGQIPRMQNTNEVQILDMGDVEGIIRTLYSHPDIRYDDCALLCYKNETRSWLNEQARAARGFPAGQPVVGDQVICLRNTERTIFNGMRGQIRKLRTPSKLVYEGSVLFEDEEVEVTGSICAPQFGRPTTFKDFADFKADTGVWPQDWDQVGLLLDYGYALTTHKAQGSQFEHVIVAAERAGRMSYDEWKRWLYTAVTRCSKYLVVLQ